VENPNREADMTNADTARSAKDEAEATVSRVGATMQRAKDEISQTAATGGEAISGDLRKLSEDVAALRDTVATLTKSLASEVGSAAEEIGADIGHAVKEEASSLVDEFEKVARKNPIAVVAGALCLGLLIGLSRGRH
jgi:ElaB/YqjD/DUF883 family membrane-anchored ribosome-binding protein